MKRTRAIVEEMLLQPRWDSLAFELAKTRTLNGLSGVNRPTYLGSMKLGRLILGEEKYFATDAAVLLRV